MRDSTVSTVRRAVSRATCTTRTTNDFEEGFFHQETEGIANNAGVGQFFGSALASGDFDGDGYTDLAIGSPYEYMKVTPGLTAQAGAVYVLFGHDEGLFGGNESLFLLGSLYADYDFANWRLFGEGLASGDFDSDGKDDLVILFRHGYESGLPGQYGLKVLLGASEFVNAGNLYLQPCDVEWDSQYFSPSLATGDFNGDHHADLAVGCPTAVVGGDEAGGEVRIRYWLPGAGFSLADLWSQDTPGILEDATSGDLFGYALVAADFDDDGIDDLAVGVPGEVDATYPSSGGVNIVYGSLAGLTKFGDQFFYPDPELEAEKRAAAAPTVPEQAALEPAYPNPFNPATTIRYALKDDARVTLKIYDLLGREVALLVDGFQVGGFYSATWDGRTSAGVPVPSGTYLYRLVAGDFTQARTMVVLK